MRGYHVFRANPFKTNAHDPYAVALKKAGTGTVGNQQVEIEILRCHVVELKLG